MLELLKESKFKKKNLATFQERQAYKHLLLQSSGHRVNYRPTGKIKENNVLNIPGLFCNCTTTKKCLWNRYNNLKHAAAFRSVAKLVRAG